MSPQTKNFSIYAPVKPFRITQPFGVNGAYYQANGVNIIGHNGWDLEARHGQPIYASHDGTAFYEIDNNQGHGVVIITDEQYDYQGQPTNFKTIYWHMCDSKKEPQFKSPIEDTYPIKVKVGDLIGYADNTGLSQGDHVHWGVKVVAKSSEAPFVWINLNQLNGYGGCVDPIPYFNGLYAEDIEKPHTFDTKLHFGMQNQEVASLQAALKKLGYFTYPTNTGYYGPMTKDAVLKFQLSEGVVQTGLESVFGFFFGPKSCDALNKALLGS